MSQLSTVREPAGVLEVQLMVPKKVGSLMLLKEAGRLMAPKEVRSLMVTMDVTLALIKALLPLNNHTLKE